MISTSNTSLQYGGRILFENVSVTFSAGNCYGLIGANGSGKSSFLKILAGDIEASSGDVVLPQGKRLSTLRQDHFKYDEVETLKTVLMGHERLFQVMTDKDAIYSKPDFSEADGLRAGELEEEFDALGGWNAEADAAELLSHLGVGESLHNVLMKELPGSTKIRVLLAQALFGNPDVLLLDEPTNNLDVETILWLEDFLYDFKNTVIVVSHDRHFLNRVCTHVADIDYRKIQLYTGNYSFWQESSELAMRQMQDRNKDVSVKRKELQSFISRFSANASKSKQATARKKTLEKLTLEDIKPSSRKYPHVSFSIQKDSGNNLLDVEDLSLSVDGNQRFKDLTFNIDKGDKVAFVGRADRSISSLFRVLMAETNPDSGSFKWGVSTSQSFFPKEHNAFFEKDLNLIDWLRQYSVDQDQNFIRGFLGRMLFTAEESLKQCSVLSGGEKVRCMLSRMMLQEANVLVLDDPTNHLDLESISALNNGLIKFQGTVLFSSHDHEFIQTIATRIIEVTPFGFIDRKHTQYDEYLADEDLKEKRRALYPEENNIIA